MIFPADSGFGRLNGCRSKICGGTFIFYRTFFAEQEEHVSSCWSRLSAAWKIFLPIKSSYPLPAVFLIGKRLSCAGRRHLQRLDDLGPEPGIWDRKILLVEKFIGDEPARLQARSQQWLFLRSEEL